MQSEERNNKLITADDAAAQLDLLRRDYGYGRGGVHETEETHLRDYWRVIRRRLWVPLTVMALTVTLTTIYNLRLPSIYEGSTRIEIAGKDRVVNLKDVQLNLGGAEDPAYLATQLKILESPKIAYRVAKALQLDRSGGFMPGNQSPRPLGKLAISEDDANERAEMERLQPYIDGLLGGVKFTPVRDTHLVDIRYRHTDPEMARKIADKWGEIFVENDVFDQQRANRKSADFLTSSISDYKLKLRNASEKLLNYTATHKFVPFGNEKENTVQTRLSAINNMLLNAEQDRKAAQMAYELTKSVKDPEIIPEIQKDQLVQDLTRRLTELRQNREKLLVDYTEEWPAVKTVNQQITQIEGEKRAAQTRILSTIANIYQSSVQKESSLQAAFKQQERDTLTQSEDSIVAKMLQQEVDTNRNMLTKLQESQSEVEVSAAGLITTNIFVRSNSTLPRDPVAPNRSQNIVLSLLLSLLGGIALVLFLDYINNKIDSVEDIDRYLRLPALGVIPVFEQPKNRKALTSGEESESRDLVHINNGNSNGSVILTQVETNSSIAESYRQLRTSLLLSSAGHAPRTLLVTSSQPAEGKTTTSVNTAISLAQTGASVLIVDADLRRPRVHKIFNLKNNVGLCNYLAGDCDLASLIQIAMPNLYVLPVGPLPPNPAELLGSSKMKIVVETLASNFDYVIIDSPPVSSFADSLILSSLVEGVIIVVRSGFTPREMAQRTKAHLQSVGAKILGVVINQIKLQPHDYYYYSSYYSRYYYSGGDSERDSTVGAD